MLNSLIRPQARPKPDAAHECNSFNASSE